jgi:hypothetical protein
MPDLANLQPYPRAHLAPVSEEVLSGTAAGSDRSERTGCRATQMRVRAIQRTRHAGVTGPSEAQSCEPATSVVSSHFLRIGHELTDAADDLENRALLPVYTLESAPML